MAEGVGFEPTDVLPSPVFKTGAINRTLPPLHIKRRFWWERQNPLLSGWGVPHLGFTTNNHRQYPPFRRFEGFVESLRYYLQPVIKLHNKLLAYRLSESIASTLRQTILLLAMEPGMGLEPTTY